LGTCQARHSTAAFCAHHLCLPPRSGAIITDVALREPIELEELDPLLYRANAEHLWRPQGARGVFGGQVLGQSLAAATRTVDPTKQVHSLHSYFVRAASWKSAIIYHVRKVRDGASFATRSISAVQNGETIFVMLASFMKPEPSRLDLQASMPVVPDPLSLPSEEETLKKYLSDPRLPPGLIPGMKKRSETYNPIDIRYVTTRDFIDSLKRRPEIKSRRTSRDGLPHQIMWLRAKGRLPDDPQVHVSVLAYASDHGLLTTTRGETSFQDIAMILSLDHAMWFHAPFRADEWLLYVMESPRSYNSRGLAIGYIFRADGTHAVTVSQEGLMRLHRSIESAPTPATPLQSKL